MQRQRPASFKKVDIVRAVRAVRAAGLEVASTEIAPDGTIRLIHSAEAQAQHSSPFDEWKQRHAHPS